MIITDFIGALDAYQGMSQSSSNGGGERGLNQLAISSLQHGCDKRLLNS